MIIPPYPFTLEDPPNVPLEDVWYARQQLFFTCWFRPMDGRQPSQGNYTIGPDDFEMQLVFFSTFFRGVAAASKEPHGSCYNQAL